LRKTPLLKNLLEQHQPNISPDEFARLSKEIDEMVLAAIDELNLLPTFADKAKRVQELLDQQNELHANTKTSCAKGCGYCCHLEVETTLGDAERLAQYIIENNISFDEAALKEQASRERMDKIWKRGFVPENRCVFLDENNSCRVYEARPSICRKHMVVSPVEDCYMPGANPITRIIPMSEIYMSALISLEGQSFGSLSKMLLKALGDQSQASNDKEPYQPDYQK
jgi:Fe-S-cluster containining protein